jgi:hypothetical protein
MCTLPQLLVNVTPLKPYLLDCSIEITPSAAEAKNINGVLQYMYISKKSAGCRKPHFHVKVSFFAHVK